MEVLNMNAKEFNDIIMREIGLEIDDDLNIRDQDTGDLIQYKGKQVKLAESTTRAAKNEIPFDPINNSQFMANMFGYYTQKLHAEDENLSVNIFYQTDKTEEGKSRIEAKVSDNGNNCTLSSKEYYNDSLKYAELISKLNGNNIDFSEIDAPIKK
jgi:hypothetical protein